MVREAFPWLADLYANFREYLENTQSMGIFDIPWKKQFLHISSLLYLIIDSFMDILHKL